MIAFLLLIIYNKRGEITGAANWISVLVWVRAGSPSGDSNTPETFFKNPLKLAKTRRPIPCFTHAPSQADPRPFGFSHPQLFIYIFDNY